MKAGSSKPKLQHIFLDGTCPCVIGYVHIGICFVLKTAQETWLSPHF